MTSSSHMFRLLLAAAVTAAAMAEQVEDYHGRVERLDISVTSLMSSNASSAGIGIVNASVYIPLPDWLEEPLLPSWLAAAIGFVAFTALAILLALCCCMGCIEMRRNSANPAELLIKSPKVLCETGSEAPTAERLRLEVLLGLQMQYLFLCLGCVYGCATGVHQLPGVLLLLAAPWLLRNLWLNFRWTFGDSSYAPIEEKGCCGGLLKHVKTVAAILVGKLENFDSASDGLAVASAYFLTEEAQRRFALSFASSTGFVGWVCQRLGLGSLMLCALLYGSLVQGMMAFFKPPRGEAALLADLVGYAAISARDQEAVDGEAASGILIFVTLARVCSESMLQALLQTSMVMAQGQSLFEQPVLALSIALSCTTLAAKAAGLIANLGTVCRSWDGTGRVIIFLLNLFAALAVLAVLALILLKLYASQSCESRMWGLTTGCMDMA